MQTSAEKTGWSRWLIGLSLPLVAVVGLGIGWVSPGDANTPGQSGQAASSSWVEPTDYVDADSIRVGISNDAMTAWEYPDTRLTSTGRFTLEDLGRPGVSYQGLPGEVLTITVNAQGFTVRSNVKPDLARTPWVGPVRMAPVSEASRLKVLSITRRKAVPSYRGAFEVVRGASAPTRLTVVNVLALEDYLKAVVPNELPMRYGLEAVRAQAVAARNYAVRPREKPWKTFDICDSQLCQAYYGAQTETPDSNRAIADTEGLVAIADGVPILALYSSSHGGYAENYSFAFSDPKTKQYPAPSIPYLVGGPDYPEQASLNLRTEQGARQFWMDPQAKSFDVASPHYRWQKQWTRTELESAIARGLQEVSRESSTRDFVSPLLSSGQGIGTLRSLKVLERGQSGKAMVLEIVTSQGRWVVQKEFLIRKVLTHGGRMLPSANIVLTPQANAQGALMGMTAHGGGFGHGVGMSQLGASWMHKQGFKFPQIIQHYYKGVSLGSLPIAVGQVSGGKPVRTRFEVKQAKGMLWVQEGQHGQPSPLNTQLVRVKLNDKLLTVSPKGYVSGVPVDQWLKPGVMNSLILFPDTHQASRPIKAWIELYPPTETPAASALPVSVAR